QLISFQKFCLCSRATSSLFAGYGNFTILSQPGGITKRLQDVLAFKVRIVSQYFLNGVARTDLANDHPYGHTHATDARLSTHHPGLLRNPIKVHHCLPASGREYHVVDVTPAPASPALRDLSKFA